MLYYFYSIRNMCCDELLSGSVEGLVEPVQSNRKYRIVGFLVTQKDLMDPASFLGVCMDGHSNGRRVCTQSCQLSLRVSTYTVVMVNAPLLQVDRVEVLREADKARLRKNDIIESVTLVTEDGEVHGPDEKWSFDSISRTAKSSPSVFALLMTVLNF